METQPLAALLTKAIATPKSIHTKDGSDALALALHCLLVNSGFVLIDERGVPTKGDPYAPPATWRKLQHEWVFVYTRPGAINLFRLHCSLQAATGRMFVHASETGPTGELLRENIQVLGLQLANYTSAERCTSDTWEDVIQNERTLIEMFSEFVLNPLWEHARKAPETEEVASGGPEAAPAEKNVPSIKSDSKVAADANVGDAMNDNDGVTSRLSLYLNNSLNSVFERPALSGLIVGGLALSVVAAVVLRRNALTTSSS